MFIGISLINLGKSTRLGIPDENTELKTQGIYTLSRNPMYVGFNLLTLASIIYTRHWIIVIFGVYSIAIYHQIIVAEEKFLEKRFGGKYQDYKLHVEGTCKNHQIDPLRYHTRLQKPL